MYALTLKYIGGGGGGGREGRGKVYTSATCRIPGEQLFLFPVRG